MRRRGLRSRLCVAAVRAMLLLVACAALFAFVGAGKRSYYCPFADRSYDAPPCADGREPTNHSDVPTLGPRDCCQVKWRAAAPPAEAPTVDQPDVAPSARLAALYASPHAIATASAKVPFDIVHAVRAGPPPPLASERRAELMVFHL